MTKQQHMVTFREHDHTYWNKAGAQYAGCTTLIGQYKNKFDAAAISQRSATRYGGSAQDYIDKWNGICKYACERGTRFHALKEEAAHRASFWIDPATGIEYPVLNHALELMKVGQPHYPITDGMPDGIYPEMLLWNHPTRTAGQSDEVWLFDKFFDIDDWKTNKQITQEGWFDRDLFENQMMLGPLNHLPDCHLTHYTLQISLYAYMIAECGRTPRNLQFTHYPPLFFHENGLPGPPDESSPVVYKVPYLKNEIEAILEPRRKYLTVC